MPSNISLGRLWMKVASWHVEGFYLLVIGGLPDEIDGVRQVLLSTLVRQMVTRFMESTKLPAVKATPRMRSRFRGGDDTLKRKVEANFAEDDVKATVR